MNMNAKASTRRRARDRCAAAAAAPEHQAPRRFRRRPGAARPRWSTPTAATSASGSSAAADGRPMAAAEVEHGLVQVALALQHCHRHLVVHRDLKPANVLLTQQGIVRLGDFGIAREMLPSAAAVPLQGTPLYRAPEVLRGQPAGKAADVWSLGVVLYQMAADEQPRGMRRAAARVRMICRGRRRLPPPRCPRPPRRARARAAAQRPHEPALATAPLDPSCDHRPPLPQTRARALIERETRIRGDRRRRDREEQPSLAGRVELWTAADVEASRTTLANSTRSARRSERKAERMTGGVAPRLLKATRRSRGTRRRVESLGASQSGKTSRWRATSCHRPAKGRRRRARARASVPSASAARRRRRRAAAAHRQIGHLRSGRRARWRQSRAVPHCRAASPPPPRTPRAARRRPLCQKGAGRRPPAGRRRARRRPRRPPPCRACRAARCSRWAAASSPSRRRTSASPSTATATRSRPRPAPSCGTRCGAPRASTTQRCAAPPRRAPRALGSLVRESLADHALPPRTTEPSRTTPPPPTTTCATRSRCAAVRNADGKGQLWIGDLHVCFSAAGGARRRPRPPHPHHRARQAPPPGQQREAPCAGCGGTRASRRMARGRRRRDPSRAGGRTRRGVLQPRPPRADAGDIAPGDATAPTRPRCCARKRGRSPSLLDLATNSSTGGRRRTSFLRIVFAH